MRERRVESYKTSALLLALIHRSGWNRYSQKFGALWLAAAVGLVIINVRRPWGEIWGR
jgi:hypothetical protein